MLYKGIFRFPILKQCYSLQPLKITFGPNTCLTWGKFANVAKIFNALKQRINPWHQLDTTGGRLQTIWRLVSNSRAPMGPEGRLKTIWRLVNNSRAPMGHNQQSGEFQPLTFLFSFSGQHSGWNFLNYFPLLFPCIFWSQLWTSNSFYVRTDTAFFFFLISGKLTGTYGVSWIHHILTKLKKNLTCCETAVLLPKAKAGRRQRLAEGKGWPKAKDRRRRRLLGG